MAIATYEPLATITLGGNDSSIDFGNVPQRFRDLVLVFNGNAAGTNADTMFYFNNDTNNGNYSTVVASGSGVGAGSNTFLTGSPVHTNGRDMLICHIMDYTATDKHKTLLITSNNASVATNIRAYRWASTSAVTSVSFRTQAQSFAAGSTFSLFGIAG